MTRKPRVEFPDAVYHVIVRGNNRERIFFLQEDKGKYLKILENYKSKYFFKVFAYAVMDNHAHLLIQVADVPLSRIMQGVQQVYTMYYNKKYARVGHVFQQRYKANICDKDRYLFALIRYIHENPTRAGIKEGLDYEWCSHRHYLLPADKGLLDIEFPLRLFHEIPSEAIRLYMEFMGDPSESGANGDPSAFYLPLPDQVEAEHEKETGRLDSPMTLSGILELVLEETGLSEAALRSGSKADAVVKARKLFTCLAFRYGAVKRVEIAGYMGISSAAVTKILSGYDEYMKLRQIAALEIKVHG